MEPLEVVAEMVKEQALVLPLLDKDSAVDLHLIQVRIRRAAVVVQVALAAMQHLILTKVEMVVLGYVLILLEHQFIMEQEVAEPHTLQDQIIMVELVEHHFKDLQLSKVQLAVKNSNQYTKDLALVAAVIFQLVMV
jgi:hypothetical protein